MIHSVPVLFEGEPVERIRVDEWCAVFDPLSKRPEFARLRLLTGESLEPSQSEIARVLRESDHD